MITKRIKSISIKVEYEEFETLEYVCINGIDVPKGLENLNKGDIYYLPDLLNGTDVTFAAAKEWQKDKRDNGLHSYDWEETTWLKRGLCHRTKEHARLHCLAILSIGNPEYLKFIGKIT